MSESGPKLSVVVATRDRAGMLGELLGSLRAQTLDPGAFEIVVVDDGSKDGTAELLKREAGREGAAPLRSVSRAASGGPGAARNDGWRAARTALVAFTDDDCVADPSWAESMLEAAEKAPGGIVQGRTDPRPDQVHLMGPFSRTQLVHEAGPYFQTCNMLYPRATLERLGGFDSERYPGFGGEDTDLAWRAIEAGAEPRFAPDARVFHVVRDLGPIGMLRFAAGWTQNMRTFADHPRLRREQMIHRLFWKGSHYLLVRALVALLLPRRLLPLRFWLARPYALLLLERGRREGGGPLLAPWYVAHDLIEVGAAVRGAVRYRTPVL